MTEPKHPMQPVVAVDRGVHRFKRNSIVRNLLDNHLGGLEALSFLDFPVEDWEQLYQLIGYSVSGYCDLSQLSEESKDAALAASRALHGEPVVEPAAPKCEAWERDATYSDDVADELCAQGWEPYAVTVDQDGKVCHYLKRRVSR